nr:hypothetical protein [Tanacetum cinerariifolium]
MVAILEKEEFNTDFHPMVVFITASPLRTVSEASLRRNLKLRDEYGIVSIPDTELFENLTLMGTYNFSKMIFDDMVKNVNNKVLKFLMYLRVKAQEHQLSPITHPFPEVESSHPTTSSIPLPSIPTASIPTVTQTDTIFKKSKDCSVLCSPNCSR